MKKLIVLAVVIVGPFLLPDAPPNPDCIVIDKTWDTKLVNTLISGGDVVNVHVLKLQDGSTVEVSPSRWKEIQIGDEYHWP